MIFVAKAIEERPGRRAGMSIRQGDRYRGNEIILERRRSPVMMPKLSMIEQHPILKTAPVDLAQIVALP
jgi:hypothetical protein